MYQKQIEKNLCRLKKRTFFYMLGSILLSQKHLCSTFFQLVKNTDFLELDTRLVLLFYFSEIIEVQTIENLKKMHTNPNESIGFVFASKIGFVSGFVFVSQKNWDSYSDSDSLAKLDSYPDSYSFWGKFVDSNRDSPNPGFGGFVFVSNPGIRWSLLQT